MRERLARSVAALGAVVGVAALALQSALTLDRIEAAGGNWLGALWRLLGYFTILTNIVVVIAFVVGALGRRAPRFEHAVATAIALVGLVYSLLLRATWNPQGWDKLADALLHDIAPPLFVAFYLLRPRSLLGVRDAALALAFPLLYVVYAMARGAAEGWYAYWFLDPRNLDAAQLTLSIAGLSAAFLAVSLILMWLSNLLNRTPDAKTR